MKICIYGAGAIGGYIAAQLAMTDAVEITCIARGPHLKAIRSRGLTLIKDGEEKVFQIKEDKKSKIPAVTHVDGTGRLQTVDPNISPKAIFISTLNKGFPTVPNFKSPSTLLVRTGLVSVKPYPSRIVISR